MLINSIFFPDWTGLIDFLFAQLITKYYVYIINISIININYVSIIDSSGLNKRKIYMFTYK